MTTRDFDNAILRQALRQALCQSLIEVLDATALDDRNVSLLRTLQPNFSSRNVGGTFDPLFLSQLDYTRAPSRQLGYARLSSLHSFLGGLTAPYKNSDSSSMTTPEQAQRQMFINEVQKMNAFVKQQTQQDTYNAFLRGSLSMQTMVPSQQLASQIMPRTPPHSTFPASIELVRAQAHEKEKATKVLKVLGTSIRGKTDRYIDVSELKIPAEEEHPPSVRGGVAEPFPMKLYRMLQDVEEKGKSHIVSFYPHGRAFGIHDMNAFTDEILPKYFSKQSKFVSFVRQLNLYGFARIHSGRDMGGYYHELFLKGRPELFPFMRRTGASSKGKGDRRKCKDRNVPMIHSDFYTMQPILPRQEC